MAKEWVKLGYEVRIIAADFSHLRRINPQINKDFEEEMIDGIHYHWVHTIKYDGNGIKRALTMFQFVCKLMFHAKKIARKFKPDVVITSSTYPLDTYAGQRISKFSNSKLIHEVHDMWPITPIEIGGMSEKNPFIVILQKAEISFCKNSDYVVSLLPFAKNYLIEKGMEKDKFIHVSNGVSKDEWAESLKIQSEKLKIIKELKDRVDLLICFFGSHTKSYSLDYIIKAVKKFENVGLLFVGNGIYKKELMEMSEDNNNIRFIDPIPKKSIPDLLKYVDVTYIGAVNNTMFRFGISMNKLFDSMMGGKPILYAVNAPNNYIESYCCGISVEAENVKALEAGIEEFLNMSEEDRLKLGNNGKNAIKENFTYESLAYKFSKIF
ncbi:MAG: glycosyltransferase WbuB [Clostridiales bacterium]|nr:MAG: glycosyltransferase WbuB [Clostridiales bacterium]